MAVPGGLLSAGLQPATLHEGPHVSGVAADNGRRFYWGHGSISRSVGSIPLATMRAALGWFCFGNGGVAEVAGYGHSRERVCDFLLTTRTKETP